MESKDVVVKLWPQGVLPDEIKVKFVTFLADYSSNTLPALSPAEYASIKMKIANRKTFIQEKIESRQEMKNMQELVTSTKAKQDELNRLAAILEAKEKIEVVKEDKVKKKKKSFFAKLFG